MAEGFRYAIRLDVPKFLEVRLEGETEESRRASAVGHALAMDQAVRRVAALDDWRPRTEPGELVGRLMSAGRWWMVGGSIGVSDVGFGEGASLRISVRWAWLESGNTADQGVGAASAAVRAFVARVREHLPDGWRIQE